MLREVFFTADDFGLDADTNRAILHAHRQGALHGASLMMGQPGTAEAIKMARDHPGLQVGFHLHLCDSKPFTREEWPWRQSAPRAGVTMAFSRNAWLLAQHEIAAQWAAYRESGLPCAFLNSHHHLHLHPRVFGELVRVVGTAPAGWLRLAKPLLFPGPASTGKRLETWVMGKMADLDQSAPRPAWPHTDTMWGVDRTFKMQEREVTRVLRRLSAGRHEFLFHPRHIDNDPDTAALVALAGPMEEWRESSERNREGTIGAVDDEAPEA